MKRRFFIVTGAVIIVLAAIAGWKFLTIHAMIKKMSATKPPPATVSTIKAAENVWQRQLHAVGSLVAVQGVTVSNELAGTVAKIAFESGQFVKQGDLLVQLDTSTDEAQLRGFEAQNELARINLKRVQELRTANINAQSDLDNARALAQQAAANVDNARAIIAKKTIRAPFSGRLGLRQVNLGQFLPAGSEIVTLQALDPIYINFSLPQQDVVHITAGQTVRVTVDAYPGQIFEGAVNAINSKIDEATRNVQVQATLKNADERLKPGMFASVDVVLPQRNEFVTLPQTTIVYNPYGNVVYSIEKSKDNSGAEMLVARQRFVQLGETRGDQVAVVKGVQAGEEIVTAGQIKLHNGSPVRIDNSVSQPDSLTPTPPNT
ncbi:MAG: efflux RND transporter periplasmic adaptor subunit [Verrucomicrobiota bacterium]|nr:efflux RND transporter periplasmic adaptor subunit [Verrucomicrobiota bacterium]